MSTVEVSKILNLVQFKIDNASYTKAIKAIRAVGNEWKRTQSKMNSAMVTGRTISGGGRGGSGGRGGGFVGPQPSRDMLIARREAIRNQRNEANRAARAQETISAGNIRRTSMFGGAGNAAMGQQVASLNAQLKSGAISLQVYRQSIAALERDFKRASAGGRDFLGTLREVRSAFIALTAANLAFTGGSAIMHTGQMFESINSAMSMSSNSTSETAANMKYIREETYRLGMDLKTSAEGFAQLRIGTKSFMDTSQTQGLFTGFSEFAKVAGIDAFRFEKSLLGLIQVANKGQLMAEDVKGQIFENMIGSQEAFLSVANQLEGKSGMMPMEEFLDKMQKGKFLAKDFLPLLGKYFSDVANSGGKLDKRLKSNETAMMRLKTVWTSFQNEIFMGGFGEALTRTFNTLAFALKNNEGAAKAIGITLGGLIDGFMYFGGTVHDVSLLTYHYLNKYILDPLTQLIPALKEIEGSWVAQAAGVMIAASAFAKLSGFLWSIVKALKMIPKLLPAATAAGGAAAAATGGAGATTAGAARFGATPVAMGAGSLYLFHNFVQDYFVPWQKSVVDSIFGGPTMRTDMRPSLQSSVSGIRVPSTLAPMSGSSPLMNQSSQNITVKVVPDGTKFADAVKVEVDAGTSNFGNTLINLMTD